MKSVVPFLLVLCAAGCSGNPNAPQPQGPIHLTGQVNASALAPGQVATVTFRLENSSSNTITLNFPSACQVMPFIARRPANDVVYPGGGGWACAQMVTSLTLAPNSVTTTEVQVRAGLTDYPVVGLAPGTYAIYARLDDMTYKLQSEPVTLVVN